MFASSGNGWIVLCGARGNNLKRVDVAIPRGLFTCVTGVSGSGKSTLVQDTLFPRLIYEVYGTRTTWAPHDALEGFDGIDKVIDIDQSPIGRTPRSNPRQLHGNLRHDSRAVRLHLGMRTFAVIGNGPFGSCRKAPNRASTPAPGRVP